MSSKIKVLFIAAQPFDNPHLRLGAEIRDIEDNLRGAPKGKFFHLISQWAVRPRDLMEILMRHRPTIVHFSGHASEGSLILEGESGQARPIEAKYLASVLAGFQDTIRMVVLNACFTLEGLTEFVNVVDFTVGTTSPVGDRAAVRFSSCFYQALAFGRSVQNSYEIAKHQVGLVGLPRPENFTLLVREGVDAWEPFVKPRPQRKQMAKTGAARQGESVGLDGRNDSPLPPDPVWPTMEIVSVGRTASPNVNIEEGSDLPMESFRGSIPVEIIESLERFKVDHPDGSRVAFLMMRFGRTQAHEDIVAGIRAALVPFGIAVVRADDKQYHDDLFPNVLTYVYGCGFGIAVFERIEREEFNPNVALEVGYMFALRKQVCLLKDRTLDTLHADLVGKLYRVFDPLDPVGTIPQQISRWLKDKGLEGDA